MLNAEGRGVHEAAHVESMESVLPERGHFRRADLIGDASSAWLTASVLDSQGGGLLHSSQLLLGTIATDYWDNYIFLILTGSVGLALSMTSFKVLSEEVSFFQAVAVRSVFSALVLLSVCWWKGLSLLEPREKLPLMIGRGVVGSAAFLCMVIATFELPLSDSAFLSNSYPVSSALLSWLLGMEHLGMLSWVGVVGCSVGNALVAHPPFLFGGHSEWGAKRLAGILAAVAGNIFMSATGIILRYIGKDVSSSVLTVYMHLCSLIICLPFLALSFPKPASGEHSVVLVIAYVVICLTGVFANLVQSRAFQIGPPTKATTLLMTNMLLSGLIGVIALSESISWLSVLGAALIAISIVLVTMQNTSSKEYEDRYQPLVISDEEVAEE